MMRLSQLSSVLVATTLLAGCGGDSASTSAIEIGSSPPASAGPTTTISYAPAKVTKEAFARIDFNASGASRFECRVDGGAAEVCESPFFAFPFEPGDHRISVTGFDAAGNAGSATTASWTVSSIFGDDADGAVHPDLIRTSVQPARVAPNSWRGIMRINCDFAHSSYDDPIVYPGQEGAAHLHRFYGHTALDHDSTITSLFTTGESSCQGNELNRSAYWVPALLAPDHDPLTGQRRLDNDGQPGWKVVPAVVGNDDVAHEIFYYSAGVSDLGSIQPIPLGLKMIAGSAMGQPGMEQDSSIVRWHCQSWESSDATNPRWSTSIPECAAPDRLRMDIFFPSCWNGTDLDSADHKSHLAYPVSAGSQTVCPSSHPVPIIRVSFHYSFGVLPDVFDPATQTSRGWRLASDHYEVSVSTPGGMSLHGDWFNAWHPDALEAVLEGCIKSELDCHDGNLGNGFRLSGTRPGTQDEPPIYNGGMGR
ncbi:DUF1996 domain-containing protein [Sphingomicrobium flavum]|uniref:DUF1996 domain-containing protein n=1 Tax=Sphingomicrobium flavum TaxID=1229164 RepID=UPI0021AD8385|nr:DUF1996 domain-containing protein [Sphingomicrobium flavum]